MAVKSQNTIRTEIQTRLADNNAGLISAADVRENMTNIVDSINWIVSSGDFDTETPFRGSNVRAARRASGGGFELGLFIAESGIDFPNGGGLQTSPYPGPGGIEHNQLAGLNVGNPHLRYMHIQGLNPATGNMPMGNSWINSSGNATALQTNNRGIKFTYTESKEVMSVGDQTQVKFDVDNSTMDSAKGVAQAWLRFNGSGDMAVISSHNISVLERTRGEDNTVNVGKFRVYFKPNMFTDGNYVAIGNSNAVGDSDASAEFNVNTVGIVERTKDYLTFYVRNANGAYVDASINDLVVYGNASGVIPSTGVVVRVQEETI
jgi:hypothetical protein